MQSVSLFPFTFQHSTQQIFSLIGGLISVRLQGNRVNEASLMTTGTSGFRDLRAMAAIAFIVIGLTGGGRFAAKHGTHEGTLHPIRMSSNKGALFWAFSVAFAVIWALDTAFFNFSFSH